MREAGHRLTSLVSARRSGSVPLTMIPGRGNAETEANKTGDREGPFAPDDSSQKFLCHPKKAPPSLLRLLTVQRMKSKQNSTCLPAKRGFISA
jgi:hypothetical protein